MFDQTPGARPATSASGPDKDLPGARNVLPDDGDVPPSAAPEPAAKPKRTRARKKEREDVTEALPAGDELDEAACDLEPQPCVGLPVQFWRDEKECLPAILARQSRVDESRWDVIVFIPGATSHRQRSDCRYSATPRAGHFNFLPGWSFTG